MVEENISTSSSNSSSNSVPNVSVNFNITSTIENIGTLVGLGAGISQVVKVVPPQSKPVVAMGLGGIAALTFISKDLINNINKSNMKVTTSDLTSISNSGDNSIMKSVMESGIFDSFRDLSFY
uniref:hypothetical protein n=1 Tax=Conidiobolus taihushanensis TaxID=2721185 RepID=UPI001D109091|nr:hypothetical protein LK112_mgp08 [Conidiobolus taihushanensis]QZZ81403.1 hypothetical protein [Conidiobolus taihushanensis]